MGIRDIRKVLFAIVATVALAAAILAACAAPTEQPETEPANPVASPSAAEPQEVERVTLEESKAAFDSKAALFLDVRSAASYTSSHIPGALSIPLAELEARINELDPNQWIITYCT